MPASLASAAFRGKAREIPTPVKQFDRPEKSVSRSRASKDVSLPGRQFGFASLVPLENIKKEENAGRQNKQYLHDSSFPEFLNIDGLLFKKQM